MLFTGKQLKEIDTWSSQLITSNIDLMDAFRITTVSYHIYPALKIRNPYVNVCLQGHFQIQSRGSPEGIGSILTEFGSHEGRFRSDQPEWNDGIVFHINFILNS